MTKKTTGNSGRKASSRKRASTRKPKPMDLLEIGPEDGDDLLEFEGSSGQRARIKVIGVGGGGGNALNTMIASGLKGVDFMTANTDAQALGHSKASVKVQLGSASGNRIRPIPMENVPPRHREALRFFEQRRASLGTLYSHEELARYLAEDLPTSERFFVLIEVTTLDPATASLKTEVEMYPVRTAQPPG